MQKEIFHPTFGSRPERIVGRDKELALVLDGLARPVGSRERCNLMLGQRGMGKTALLLEIEEHAKERGFVVARVNHNESMLEEIIELIQLHGSEFVKDKKRTVKGVSAGALGFSFGLTFSEETERTFGFRVKLDMLCKRLEEANKSVLILVDEVKTSEKMRTLASNYQILAGEGRNIALCMAGLPHSVSSVLNDDVLTFLNRASRFKLGPIAISEVRSYYEAAFEQIGLSFTDDFLDDAANFTQGFPYLMQLLGFYIAAYSEGQKKIGPTIVQRAKSSSHDDLENNVFKPILAPLSENDIQVLRAMASNGEHITTAALLETLGRQDSQFQPYRARLLGAGVIEAPRRGELAFAVPLLAEYLRSTNNHA